MSRARYRAILMSLARLSTRGCAGAGLTTCKTSVATDRVGVTGFVSATAVPATSAVSDTASGSKNERFLIMMVPSYFFYAFAVRDTLHSSTPHRSHNDHFIVTTSRHSCMVRVNKRMAYHVERRDLRSRVWRVCGSLRQGEGPRTNRGRIYSCHITMRTAACIDRTADLQLVPDAKRCSTSASRATFAAGLAGTGAHCR